MVVETGIEGANPTSGSLIQIGVLHVANYFAFREGQQKIVPFISAQHCTQLTPCDKMPNSTSSRNC
jgi:hypothetical protein